MRFHTDIYKREKKHARNLVRAIAAQLGLRLRGRTRDPRWRLTDVGTGKIVYQSNKPGRVSAWLARRLQAGEASRREAA